MLFASNNLGKVCEAREILNINLLSLKDIDKEIEVNENGETFMENAILKAKEVYRQTGIPAISDDSGLLIDALDGFPGVLTNRFLGNDKTDSEKNQAILKKMDGIFNRTCYFVCSVAYFDGINLITSEYSLKGEIAKEENINKGFGFDSIFLYNGKYLSDMSILEKNKISPRQIALTNLVNDKNFQKNVDFIN